MKDSKKQLKENLLNIQKLKGDYDKCFSNLALYIRCELTEEDGEEVINDVLEILLGAQSRNEDVHSVIGDDYKTFCDDIINSYRENCKFYFLRELKDMIPVFFKMLLFFISLDILTNINFKNFSFYNLRLTNYNLTLQPFLSCIIGVILALFIIKILANNSTKIFFIKTFLLQFLGIFLIVYLGIKFRKFILISIPNMLVLSILAIIILFIYTIIMHKQIKN